jgi:uncharacterized repeat protein (TIGR01451 family)
VLTGVGFTNFRSFGAVIFNTTSVTISNASFINNANGVGIFGASFNTLSNIIGSNNSGLGVVISNDGPFQGGRSNILNGGIISNNRLEGIRIFESLNNVILNTTVSGNGDGGSVVGSQATGNRFLNNVFRSNIGAGLGMASGASNTLITGSVFTGNAVGIGRSVSAGQGNRFIGNLFRQQSVLGIDVGFDRVPSPAEVPSLTSATQTNSTRIQGTFRGRPNATYTIEFYSNANCNPSGFGEGQFALDTVPVTTDGSGNASIDVTLDATIPAGQLITATATGDVAGTSEFSRCIQVSGAARPDMALTKSGPASISPGERITYTLEAKNLGQATALGVTVTDGLPACLILIFCDASQGDCSVEGNTVTANLGSIDINGTAMVTIAARVSEACGQGLTNTARIAAASDTSAANDTSTASTSIRPGPRITSLRLKGGSKLIVTGEGFESGAKINLIKPGGAETQINKTKFNSQSKLTGKGVVIAPGDRVVVENPDGVRSNEFVFAASG